MTMEGSHDSTPPLTQTEARTWVKIRRIVDNAGHPDVSNDGIWVQIERLPKEKDPTPKGCGVISKECKADVDEIHHASPASTPARTYRQGGKRRTSKTSTPEKQAKPVARQARHRTRLQDCPPTEVTSIKPPNKVKGKHGQLRVKHQPIVRVERLTTENKEGDRPPGGRMQLRARKMADPEACSTSSVSFALSRDAYDKWHSTADDLGLSHSQLAMLFLREQSLTSPSCREKGLMMYPSPSITFLTTPGTYNRWQTTAQERNCSDSELAAFLLQFYRDCETKHRCEKCDVALTGYWHCSQCFATSNKEVTSTSLELAQSCRNKTRQTGSVPVVARSTPVLLPQPLAKENVLLELDHSKSKASIKGHVSIALFPAPSRKTYSGDNKEEKVPPVDNKSDESNDGNEDLEDAVKADPADEVDYANVLHELVDMKSQKVPGSEDPGASSVSDEHNKCQVCDKTFADPQELCGHVKETQHGTDKKAQKEKESDDPLHCKLCDKTFSDPDQFTYHLAKHRGDMKHECGLCRARFFKAQILVLHARFHQEDTQFNCPRCQASFLTKRALALHNQWQVCEAMLTLQQQQKESRLNSAESEAAQAPEQDRGLLNSEALVEETFTPRSKQGRKRRYFPKRDKWQCYSCGASFSTGRQLERHSSVHSGVKKFGCQICGAAFPQNCSLVAHMKSHSSFKPYQCGACHKTFKYPRFLRIHNCKPDAAAVSRAKLAQAREPKTGGAHKHKVLKELASTQKASKMGVTLSTKDLQPLVPLPSAPVSGVSVKPLVLMQDPVKTESDKEDTSVCVTLDSSPAAKSEDADKSQLTACSVLVKPDAAYDNNPHQTIQQQKQHESTPSENTQTAQNSSTILPEDNAATSTTQHSPSASSIPAATATAAAVAESSKSSVRQPGGGGDKRPYHCSHCQACFHFPGHLSQHLHGHTGQNGFHCPQCRQTFKFIYSYTRHMNQHRELGPGVPLRCTPTRGPRGVAKLERTGFIAHGNTRIQPLPKTHPDQRPLYQCPYCDKKTTRYQLVQHLRVHTGERPFTCEVCGKSFTRMETYRKHRIVHTTDKPHMCPQCGKCFRTKSYLTQHVKGHSNKVLRPFVCEHCHKSYHSARYLKEHTLVVHAGKGSGRSQQFSHTVCDICGKSVTRPYLKIHMRTHSGEKPYLCGTCPASFVSSTQLKVHQRRKHTGEKPYQCEFCGKRFVQSFERRYHYRRHHKNQTNQTTVFLNL